MVEHESSTARSTVDLILELLKPPCHTDWDDYEKTRVEKSRDDLLAVVVYVRPGHQPVPTANKTTANVATVFMEDYPLCSSLRMNPGVHASQWVWSRIYCCGSSDLPDRESRILVGPASGSFGE